jgi:formyltetrahydrofolate deformylase
MPSPKTATLLIDCPDRKGLVAAIMTFLVQQYDVNILNADQHQDAELGLFFMRIEFSTEVDNFNQYSFHAAFEPTAQQFCMNWRIELADDMQNVALFVSQYLHCLADLLHRHQTGEFSCNLALIVSNHEDARPLAEFHRIPFHHMPVERDTKPQVEAAQLALLSANNIDLVVLARYMQVLSPHFVDAYPRRIINVHHSFLPAFTGARPYHAAFARGVKLIGATSHYVTDTLDEGPIIEQDVAPSRRTTSCQASSRRVAIWSGWCSHALCNGTSIIESSPTPTRRSSSLETILRRRRAVLRSAKLTC